MSSSPPSKYYRVGVLIFPGADILDFAGPMEVLSHVSHNQNPDNPDRMFEIRTISRTTEIRAASSLTVHADMLFSEALDCISDFHVLVIPGGPPSVIHPLINTKGPEIDFIRKFSNLPSSERGARVLFSVCTGAFFLGAAGVLAGIAVTTHHRALDALRDICARANDPNEALTNVVHKRYVDGGLLSHKGVRIITAGGISSGLDATYYLVSQLATDDMASFVARVMEYDWCKLKV